MSVHPSENESDDVERECDDETVNGGGEIKNDDGGCESLNDDGDGRLNGDDVECYGVISTYMSSDVI